MYTSVIRYIQIEYNISKQNTQFHQIIYYNCILLLTDYQIHYNSKCNSAMTIFTHFTCIYGMMFINSCKIYVLQFTCSVMIIVTTRQSV